MNLLSLSWKNIVFAPLNTALTLILFSLGIGLITFLILVNDQLKDNFDKNLASIDLVIGAKGSPLQMILCNMYHIDNPTGNISIKDVSPFLNPNHPLISTAVPLSLGDSYKGFRIVGTDHSFIELYNARLSEGKIFENDFDVNIGSNAAKELNLQVGDRFKSTHGFEDEVDFQHDHGEGFVVKGIFERSGTVLDQLILSNTASIWHVHGGDGEDHAEQNEAHHEHNVSNFKLVEHPNEEITSVLVKFKTRNFQTLMFPRNINQNTSLQAATPAIEMNRLHDMIGIGVDAIRNLALLIAIVSGISVFISLYNTLRDRKYELALMRVSGATPTKLFTLILFEGMILAVLGCILGIALGHLGIEAFGQMASDRYNYSFTAFKFLRTELFVIIASLLIGIIAALVPAIIAYKTEIHKTLAA